MAGKGQNMVNGPAVAGMVGKVKDGTRRQYTCKLLTGAIANVACGVVSQAIAAKKANPDVSKTDGTKYYGVRGSQLGEYLRGKLAETGRTVDDETWRNEFDAFLTWGEEQGKWNAPILKLGRTIFAAGEGPDRRNKLAEMLGDANPFAS